MRDAFGGAFMIKLLLVFLIIYIAFIAVGLNYARTFRIKSQIINYIEEYEGFNDNSKTVIDEYLRVNGYNPEIRNQPEGALCYDGYCIRHSSSSSGKSYYTVYTFLNIEVIPFLPRMKINIPIKGETKSITNDFYIGG